MYKQTLTHTFIPSYIYIYIYIYIYVCVCVCVCVSGCMHEYVFVKPTQS